MWSFSSSEKAWQYMSQHIWSLKARHIKCITMATGCSVVTDLAAGHGQGRLQPLNWDTVANASNISAKLRFKESERSFKNLQIRSDMLQRIWSRCSKNGAGIGDCFSWVRYVLEFLECWNKLYYGENVALQWGQAVVSNLSSHALCYCIDWAVFVS